MLQEILTQTRRLLGHDVDLHDSQWIGYELDVKPQVATLTVDWAIFGGQNRTFARTGVRFAGLSNLQMPSSWESVYEWDLARLEANQWRLRMTENHQGQVIQIVSLSIDELSVLPLPMSDYRSLFADSGAPRGAIRLDTAVGTPSGRYHSRSDD